MQHHKASLSDLPLETLKAVACLLPARAIVRLSTTCRALRPIVAVPAVWERIDFSDIEPGLTDAGYTGFLAQITKWMAPYSPKNDITGMVTGHLPTEIVEMKFDGTVVSYYTVIAAMRLPRAQRVSFQGCRIDDIPDDLEGMLLQEYAAKALVTAQANVNSSQRSRSMDLSDCRTPKVSYFSKELIAVSNQLKKRYPNLVLKPAICNNCWGEVVAGDDPDVFGPWENLHQLPIVVETLSGSLCWTCLDHSICTICDIIPVITDNQGTLQPVPIRKQCCDCHHEVIFCARHRNRLPQKRTCSEPGCTEFICRTCARNPDNILLQCDECDRLICGYHVVYDKYQNPFCETCSKDDGVDFNSDTDERDSDEDQ